MLSKLLLGNQDRLEVGVAIARSEDGLVNATDLSRELGLVQPRVQRQLATFEKAEILSRMPKTEPKQWFKRQDSPYWEACLLLDAGWGG